MPMYKGCSNISRKLEAIYFAFLIAIIGIYIIIVSVLTLIKNNQIYDTVYKTDILCRYEMVRHIDEMMKIESNEIKKLQKNPKALIKVTGTNPILGYILHRNRNYNIKYVFTDTRPILNNANKSSSSCSAGGANSAPSGAASGSGPCLKKKTFLFKESNKSNPYTLSDECEKGMLHPSNIPCSLLNGSTIHADPFYVENGIYAVRPDTLKKNLQSLDMYGQISRLAESSAYFKGFMLKKNDNAMKCLSKDQIKGVCDKIGNCLKMDFVIIRGISPFQDSVASLKKATTGYNTEETLNSFMGDTTSVVAAFVDDGSFGIGYNFTAEDLKKIVFTYSNNQASKSYIIVKKTDFVIMIGSQVQPSEETLQKIFDQGAQVSEGNTQIPKFAVCDMLIDVQTGLVKGCQDNFIRRPISSSPNGPILKDLFKNSFMLSDIGSSPESIFVFHIDCKSLMNQNMNSSSKDAVLEAKKYLVSKCVGQLKLDDPGNTIQIDNNVSNSILNGLKSFYGSAFPDVSGVISDLLLELPMQLAQKTSIEGSMGANDYKKNYITYDRFVAKMMDMKQRLFFDEFFMNCENARAASHGLKMLYDDFNYTIQAHLKNVIMMEITFYIVVVIGLFEFTRFIVSKSINTSEEAKNVDEKANYQLKMALKGKIWSQSFALQVAIGFMIYVFVVSLLFAWKEKSHQVFTYNNMIVERNGEVIAGSYKDIMINLSDAILLDKQFVSVGGVLDTGDPDDLFDEMKKKVALSDSPVTLSVSYDLMAVYTNLMEAVESFEKCNKLLRTDAELPFPLLEMSLYVMMIIIISIIAAVTIAQLAPFEKLANMKRYRAIEKAIDTNKEVSLSSFGFSCESDSVEKIQVDNLITYITSILIALISVLFATTLFSNTLSFSNALYGSDLFKKSMCYEL
jgi:hypothetical protein